MTRVLRNQTPVEKIADHEKRIRDLEAHGDSVLCCDCAEASLGAYEGNPTTCEVAPGSGLLPRMPESLGPIRYVDFDAGNDGNDGLTPATPWRTITDSGSYHGQQPGWILYCTGTYTLSSNPDFDYSAPGSALQPITYQAWPGMPVPTIHFNFGGRNMFGAQDTIYWRFRGFNVVVTPTESLYNPSNWFEWDSCSFSRDVIGGYFSTYGYNQTYIGCSFVPTDPAKWMNLDAYGGVINPGQGDRLSVLNCLFADMTGSIAYVNSFDARDCVIANNTFANSDFNDGMGVELYNESSGWQIVNNIFSSSAGPAIKCAGSGGSGNIARNNLFWEMVGSPIVDATPTQILDAGSNVEADPLFVTDPGDYRLQPSSPANAAADPFYVPAADLLGANRPNTVLAALPMVGDLVILNLPVVDPGVPGALWNDSGTVKVS